MKSYRQLQSYLRHSAFARLAALILLIVAASGTLVPQASAQSPDEAHTFFSPT